MSRFSNCYTSHRGSITHVMQPRERATGVHTGAIASVPGAKMGAAARLGQGL